MDTIIGKFFVTFLTTITLTSFNAVRAEEMLSQEKMDLITAGLRITDFASNSIFQAKASAEGTEISVNAEVGNDFGRAKGTSKSFRGDSASSRAEAHGIPGVRVHVQLLQILPDSRFKLKPRPFKSFSR